ncbi:MAG: 50S ribosomal protein L4 [Candidatus Magasanikbacteria bacterium RIFCSPHIGHO2_02_FULL_47_14]|uniref:Large ribosomal subunit protein uL4 n=1 Tax=Candidatus Magasanikbacteria bacterium RIFCSPHIGHO2_02_FULL_47_14 TaxID=1798680 RepID=A0A1F6LYN4_9BACT|nr:MAG: 50S ribosomal protein L4 [Candidatus Magasanikbacteria bacterium RIFCSPHIGHO2_02_FULL_47_14]
MVKVPVYNQEGKEVSTIELADTVFGVAMNEALVYQVYVVQEANARLPWAHTKNRGDVRGGGKKPWKQKGTGRARHGSIRSPIWKGGGVTFGPRNERSYTRKVNDKMKQKAVTMCLSEKLGAQQLIVIDNVQTTGKTKEFATMRRQLPVKGGTLVIVDTLDQNTSRAVRNIKDCVVERAQNVNVSDLLHNQSVIVTKGAVEALQKRFVK